MIVEFDWEAYLDTHCGRCDREYFDCECDDDDGSEEDDADLPVPMP